MLKIFQRSYIQTEYIQPQGELPEIISIYHYRDHQLLLFGPCIQLYSASHLLDQQKWPFLNQEQPL